MRILQHHLEVCKHICLHSDMNSLLGIYILHHMNSLEHLIVFHIGIHSTTLIIWPNYLFLSFPQSLQSLQSPKSPTISLLLLIYMKRFFKSYNWSSNPLFPFNFFFYFFSISFQFLFNSFSMINNIISQSIWQYYEFFDFEIEILKSRL
jgi:hypothetical protein